MKNSFKSATDAIYSMKENNLFNKKVELFFTLQTLVI